MDKGNYLCYVLDYNTETWLNCDDETTTQYPGHPSNVYNDLSIDKKQKRGKKCVWIDHKGLCTCCKLEKTLLYRELTLLLQASQYQKRRNILRRE